jgi:hypothetical protein
MKLEASLLRPIIDIIGNADFCTELNLDSKITIPKLDVNVDLEISKIPVNLTVKYWIGLFNWFGWYENWLLLSGSIGEIGLKGPITISTGDKPIDMTLGGCMTGIARINPLKPIAPRPCCDDYQVPVSCQCEVHRDHNYCDPNCKCK